MANLILNGSTSGSVTLSSPAVSGTTTLTLPVANGTIITTGSPQSGSVLQVVNATYSTEVTSSSSTYADTNLTASITPKFSTSKVLVIVNQNGVSKEVGNTGVNLKLLRNSTDIISFGVVIGYTNGTVANLIGTTSCSFLDSPATTSSVTYKTQFASNNNIANAKVQQFSATSTIILMEIAA
jgi:hypothetical protein